LRYARGEAIRPKEEKRKAGAPSIEQPPWLSRSAATEKPEAIIYPSLYGDVEPAETSAALPAAGAGGDARRRGLLIHKLLEQLPLVEASQRADEAQRIARGSQAALGKAVCDEAISSAIQLMTDPRFEALFGSESRGEVAVQGKLDGATVSGEIDRLVVMDDRVIVGEFKSTRWVPASEDRIQRAHRQQVTIYRRLVEQIFPDRPVEAWLVYVAAPIAFRIS
ncbi:MAG: PD-(D/E)XK nuclease family protein, partial [Parvularculaceae bacterium]|nr:PD-(D/E)XK nuclease family protein [Parvularculaceae bacterium]